MAGSSWTDQLVNLIVLSAAQKGFSGFFVYSPAPGAGNLIGSWSAVAGTDQYGNPYPAGLSVALGSLTGTSIFLYSGTPAAGNLLISVTGAAGTDSHGNIYLAGIAVYGSGFAASMQAGELGFYLGSLAGGWTLQGELLISLTDGHLISNFGNTELAGALLVDGNAVITGTLSVNGSPSVGFPNPNATSTNGLSDGTIHGTSGGASAGTAHTHGPGSFAVGSGQHSHDLQNHGHPL